ncbi:unnamed protein product [Meganyctiphanes norvegica]|uniref:Uncharacterized protein n=1 Tax=Meganyctiphanes norvegica TaxID=48144 RepID=A0AAV2SYM4_MEGNR
MFNGKKGEDANLDNNIKTNIDIEINQLSIKSSTMLQKGHKISSSNVEILDNDSMPINCMNKKIMSLKYLSLREMLKQNPYIDVRNYVNQTYGSLYHAYSQYNPQTTEEKSRTAETHSNNEIKANDKENNSNDYRWKHLDKEIQNERNFENILIEVVNKESELQTKIEVLSSHHDIQCIQEDISKMKEDLRLTRVNRLVVESKLAKCQKLAKAIKFVEKMQQCRKRNTVANNKSGTQHKKRFNEFSFKVNTSSNEELEKQSEGSDKTDRVGLIPTTSAASDEIHKTNVITNEDRLNL